MSRSEENESEEDRGASFTEVILYLPTEGKVDSLGTEDQQLLRRNIDRAKKVFLARTLPLPMTTYQSKYIRRYHPSLSLTGGPLDDLVRTTLMEGLSFEDESIIVQEPRPQIVGLFVRRRLASQLEYSDFERSYAADLLGKFWYRAQENPPRDLIDAVISYQEYEELVKAGDPEPAKAFVEKKIPPSKPRRK